MCSRVRRAPRWRSPGALAILLWLWLAVPLAQAEDGAPGIEAATRSGELSPRSGPAAALAPTSPPVSIEPSQAREARELTGRARERFEAGDYGAALVGFSRAYELLEGHPRRGELLNNIAVCQERMFRYDLALHYYERYLHEGGSNAADRAEVEAVIRGLRGLLGSLRITSNVSSEIWIDDRPFGTGVREVLVPAGPHVVELRARAYEPARREVQVAARAAQSIHFELQPVPQYQGVHRAYFWTGVGLTSTALLTGGVLGLRARAKHEDAKALNRRGLATLEDEPRYQNLALASVLAFGTAALFGVGSTVLLFLTDWQGRSSEKRSSHATRLSLQPQLTAHSLQVGVRGAWR